MASAMKKLIMAIKGKTREDLLGKIVKDQSSGLTGVCVSLQRELSGNVRYGLQPHSKDGATVPEGYDVDSHFLIETTVKDRKPIQPEPEVECDIQLGNHVKDVISGYEGVATKRVTFLNGCVYFMVVAKGLDKEGKPHSQFLEVQRLKMTSRALHPIAEKAKVEPNKPARGGPRTPMMRP